MELDEAIVEGARRIANARIHKAYPLCSEEHIDGATARIYAESLLELSIRVLGENDDLSRAADLQRLHSGAQKKTTPRKSDRKVQKV